MPHHCGNVCAFPAAPNKACVYVWVHSTIIARDGKATYKVQNEHDDLSATIHCRRNDVAVKNGQTFVGLKYDHIRNILILREPPWVPSTYPPLHEDANSHGSTATKWSMVLAVYDSCTDILYLRINPDSQPARILHGNVSLSAVSNDKNVHTHEHDDRCIEVLKACLRPNAILGR